MSTATRGVGAPTPTTNPVLLRDILAQCQPLLVLLEQAPTTTRKES